MKDNRDTKIHIPSRIYRDIERKVVSLYKKLRLVDIPINPKYIAERQGYDVIPFSKADSEFVAILRSYNVHGVTRLLSNIKGKHQIYYDDSKVFSYQKFTIMHEIGHIMLGHKEDSELAEIFANYFAGYVLAPSPLILKYGCENKEDLAAKFKISDECANICVVRYQNWQSYGGELKDYEIELLDLVK